MAILTALALAGTSWLAPAAQAQHLPGLPGLTGTSKQDGPATGPDALADAIRQAAQSGVSVIVVDESGRLISAVAPQTQSRDGTADGDAMEDASELMKMQGMMQHFEDALKERLTSLPNSLNEVTYILRKTSPTGEIFTYVRVLLTTLAFLLVAQLLTRHFYARRVLGRVLIPRIVAEPMGYLEKMPFLLLRFLGGLSVTAITIVVAYVSAIALYGRISDISIQFTVTSILVAYAAMRTGSDFWRMVLSPYLSQYRLPSFSDRDARRLYRWLWILLTFDVATIVFSTWIKDFGLNYNVYAVLHGTLAFFGTVANIAMIAVNAPAVSNAIRDGNPVTQVAWPIRLLSTLWAPFLIVFVIFGWINLIIDLVMARPVPVPMVVAAYLIFMAIIVVYGAANFLIERYFEQPAPPRPAAAPFHDPSADPGDHPGEDPGDDPDPADTADDPMRMAHHGLTTFKALAKRSAGILAIAAGALASLQIWEAHSTLISESIIDTISDIAVVVFIGYVCYNAARIWIDHRIAEEVGDQPEEAETGNEGGGTGASRLATLLPLFRGVILSVVFATITLIVLMELGVNVSPLFAGAGVVGIAVGFGAQTLIRDIFSGAFFLIDDAFRKGEYIDLGDVKGTVEKISVRSMQLRHHRGALNTVPFGEIKVLTNYSRDWVIMKLPLRVTYDTDVEKVRKLIKKLGQELLDDPVIGHNFIEPLKSQGVIEMQDSAMIIRVKFMTKPGDQWLVRKKVYEDIRELFNREGIHFAHREVTVRLADGVDPNTLTEEQKKAVTGAVRTMVEEEENGNSQGDR
ncbi:mechanosensitive ion channel family protein [Chachezhania sediminis]|uniref:mechanosensitive ion channel family protein n=1 Tax=Chachezhania sediminis TaxID=2599291 RepID=UPI00131D4DC9|nr:mechanosensitive ion channel domain-containing protein [Chachezhania sediminis]